MTKLKAIDHTELELNLAYLHDIADGSKEFMLEMIDIFLSQTPEYVSQIQRSIEQKDWLVVAEIAHKIRPTFTFIGVDVATQTMASIEHKARSGVHLEEIAHDFNQLKPILDGVFRKLLEIRKDFAQ